VAAAAIASGRCVWSRDEQVGRLRFKIGQFLAINFAFQQNFKGTAPIFHSDLLDYDFVILGALVMRR